MKSKTEKRKDALARMERGDGKRALDRPKKHPRSEEARLAEMDSLRKKIGGGY